MPYNTIDPSEYEKIKRMYVHGLVPMIKLADRYGVTRQTIYKVLLKAGVETGKHGKVPLVCLHCGKKYGLHRCRIRKLRGRYRYCSAACFKKAVGSPPLDVT